MLLRVAPTATHTKKTNKSAYGRNCTQKAVIQRGVAPAILPLADFFSRRRSTDILITKSRMVLGVFAIRMKFQIGGYSAPKILLLRFCTRAALLLRFCTRFCTASALLRALLWVANPPLERL